MVTISSTESPIHRQAQLKKANVSDAQAISELLNICYRGNEGWTTEAGLVEGDRSTTHSISHMINDKQGIFFKVEQASFHQKQIIACIYLTNKINEINFGSFAVHPNFQGLGLGKIVLNKAEHYARTNFDKKPFSLLVLSNRPELVSYYQRRGYQLISTEHQAFPIHQNVGTPLKDNLFLEKMIKPTP